MANDVVSEPVKVKRRGKAPKEEKLLRKRSFSMILIVEKKQDSGEPYKYREVHADREVECHETKKPYKRVERKTVAGSDRRSSAALDRAIKVQESLGPKCLSFVKNLQPSQVSGGFWMGLPLKFCRLHLPNEDTRVILEDDDNVDFKTKYLSEKVGLSGGWRGYAIEHKLVVGDVLLFQLVSRTKPTKFKIHTFRADDSDEVNGGCGLLTLDKQTEEMDPTENTGNAITQESTQNDIPTQEPEIDVEDHENDILGGIRLAETVIPFREVRTIADFNIMVSGLIIDSEFSREVMRKYYDLCRREGAYLHEHLLEGIYYKLATAAINAVTNIADGVAEASGKQLATWDKVLEGFGVMGMNVRFLRDQIGELIRVRDV